MDFNLFYDTASISPKNQLKPCIQFVKVKVLHLKLIKKMFIIKEKQSKDFMRLKMKYVLTVESFIQIGQ